jgi:superfamily I DNA and/or RNA helicase
MSRLKMAKYPWYGGGSLPVVILEDVRATTVNQAEAELVAGLAVALRERLLDSNGNPFENTEEGDRRFWRSGLFIVSPHHAKIRAILRELAARRKWLSPPFVDTVDKMQGQQSEAVIVSYGVSDVETALAEAEFIYSLNRLNVSITRAKSKCVLFLPRPLLVPSLDLL